MFRYSLVSCYVVSMWVSKTVVDVNTSRWDSRGHTGTLTAAAPTSCRASGASGVPSSGELEVDAAGPRGCRPARLCGRWTYKAGGGRVLIPAISSASRISSTAWSSRCSSSPGDSGCHSRSTRSSTALAADRTHSLTSIGDWTPWSLLSSSRKRNRTGFCC